MVLHLHAPLDPAAAELGDDAAARSGSGLGPFLLMEGFGDNSENFDETISPDEEEARYLITNTDTITGSSSDYADVIHYDTSIGTSDCPSESTTTTAPPWVILTIPVTSSSIRIAFLLQ
jgi:hypothetical protein